jgi:hypothetical protein
VRRTMVCGLAAVMLVILGAVGGAEAWDRGVHGRPVVRGAVVVGPRGWRPGWGPYRWWGPRVFVAPPLVVAPAPLVVVPPPVVAAPPLAAVGPQTPPAAWYYCADSNAYYPSVTQCPSGWVAVAPTP